MCSCIDKLVHSSKWQLLIEENDAGDFNVEQLVTKSRTKHANNNFII